VRSIFGGKYGWLLVSLGFLLIAIAFRQFFIIQKNIPEINASVVKEKLIREIESNQEVLEKLRSVILQSESYTFSSLDTQSKYPYYIFSNMRIIYWSKSDYVPNYRDILGDFELGYIETDRGKFIAQKEIFIHQRRQHELVFLIPLIQEFPIVNQYLYSTFNEEIFTDVNFEIVEKPDDAEFVPVEIHDRELFQIKFGNTYANAEAQQRHIIVFFIILSLLAFFLFIRKVLQGFTFDGAVYQGFFFLVLTLVAIRSLMLLTNFPLDFVYIEIFDPRFYGSTMVNSSLGDLFLNLLSLLFIGLYVFNNFTRPWNTRRLLRASIKSKTIISIACIFFSFFWLSVHHQTMKTLNFDSQWSMDITQKLDFDYFKISGYGLYFISVIIYFLFVHVCFRLFNQLNTQSNRYFYLAIFFGLLLFIGFALIFQWEFEVVILVNLGFFLVVRFFRLHKYLSRLQYLTFIYFFSFGLPGAIIGVYANYQYNTSNTDYNMSRLANQLLVERNFFTEMQLADAARQIKEDSWIPRRIISPFASKEIIEKKIKVEYLTNLDQFEANIIVFNSRGEPFEEFDYSDNFRAVKSRNYGNETDTEGLYFIPPGPEQPTAKYFIFIEIEERGQVIGYILLEMNQKRLVPNSVFPLLINEGLYAQQIENQNLYSYSFFANKRLQYSSGPFNYRRFLENIIEASTDLFEESAILNGYVHKAFLGENDRFVIVSLKAPSFNQRMANFSFLFLIFIFSILLILISIAIYQSFKQIKLNYAAKIQLYLNFAFFTPLIIVSITIISIIVQSFKTSLESQYMEYAENLRLLISDPLSEYRNLEIDREELADQLYGMAEVADVDMNIFHNGRLIASSLYPIYQNNILSYNIAPEAYIRLMENKESACVLEEQVGSLNFKNVYISVRSEDSGAVIGILSLPFFASQQDLEQRIIDILSYIINIFTFLFVIFLFVSFFVSRGLTFPLWLITQKIKRTTLSSFNEPLSWNSDDEIGLMVAEYNRMLVNLEESKNALAKSEKESAWREMARQVAHEIKNPLTPMKLTLQHMKRIIDEGGDNGATEQKQKQINSLLEQIETLSDIATSFSDFAKMPAPKIDHLDIRALLLETIELYNKKELGKIVTNIEDGIFMIEGDKKWLGRALSNLIINAFQSVNDQSNALLHVSLFKKGRDMVRIEIQDNGEGIPLHIGEKVFTPNFSTKYTGSGLGLAITKKGVEHANGKIWFQSEEGVGDDFLY
jgi:two-component system nitrogen regulation sensor histidine kinase NtrY